MGDAKSPSFVDYILIIAKRRRFIIKTVLVVLIASIIISFILRPQYTSTSTILPPNPQQDAMFGLMMGSMTSNIGNLSRLSNIIPGSTTASDLYAAILKSGSIMGKIIQKYDLKKIFKTRTSDDTFKELKNITHISVSSEGIISISVTWFNRKLASDIANSYVEELDRFNTESAMTVGKRYRIFIEQRLQNNQDSLKIAEEQLKSFQEKNKTIALDVEIKSAIETFAKLKSEIILRQVQKGTWSSFSQDESPYLENINREIREFENQISKIGFGTKGGQSNEFGAGFSMPFSKLPEVSLEYARLLRDVKVQEAIFELLTQQYEQAKIMELKDTPTVQFLDRASPAEKKSSPQRSRIVILAFIFSLIFSIAGCFVLEATDQIKDHPKEHEKWFFIYSKLSVKFNAVINPIRKLLKKSK